MAIRFSPQALAQLQAAHAWWRTNRPSAPRLLRSEVAEALELLQMAPRAGMLYPHRRLREVRRLILHQTRHYLYYVIDEQGMTILAVWSALRQKPPKLP